MKSLTGKGSKSGEAWAGAGAGRPRASEPMRAPGSAEALLHLQRTSGNQAVGRLLAAPRSQLQAQLRIGQPGDVFEREADRVANMVAGPAPPHGGLPGISQIHGAGAGAAAGALRRCALCGGDRGVDEAGEASTAATPATLQRKCRCEQGTGDELVQSREAPGSSPRVPAGFPAQVASLRGGGVPLSPAQRGFFEPRFGHDFGAVRLHTGAPAERAAEAVQARAFTLGEDVVFGRGEYAPDSPAGRHLLAHELTHVVQQTPLVARRQPLVQRAPVQPQSADSDPATDQAAAATQGSAPPATAAGLGFRSQESPAMASWAGSTTVAEFATGSAVLTSAQSREISRIAGVQADLLARFPLSTVQVIGHADTVGGAPANLALGQTRADAVKEALVTAGVPGPIVTTESLGEGRPQLVPTRDEIPEARNRGVEIRFHARGRAAGKRSPGTDLPASPSTSLKLSPPTREPQLSPAGSSDPVPLGTRQIPAPTEHLDEFLGGLVQTPHKSDNDNPHLGLDLSMGISASGASGLMPATYALAVIYRNLNLIPRADPSTRYLDYLHEPNIGVTVTPDPRNALLLAAQIALINLHLRRHADELVEIALSLQGNYARPSGAFSVNLQTQVELHITPMFSLTAATSLGGSPHRA
jgi:outer membrane protein OmpA-like peptidoglycan-associated protein